MTRVLTPSGWLDVNGPALDADEASAEFFDAAANDRLLLRWCPSCHGWAAPATESCPHCFHHNLDWRAADGEGELVSWTIVHSPPHPAFAADMPIVSAIVELREGPWLNLRLIGSRSDLRAGASVGIAFAHSGDSVSYPVAILSSSEELL